MSDKPLNIVFSSHASAGGTTLALIHANTLGLRYIYAGGVLKEWADLMGYDSKTAALHKWEQEYGDHWDIVWENYIVSKLSAEPNFLCEGKTAGFLLPSGRAYEVFVTAPLEVRAQRAGGDGRTEDIAARDHLLGERWLRLFNVDFLNPVAIRDNYDLLLDTGALSIEESCAQIRAGISGYFGASEVTERYHANFPRVIGHYWANERSDRRGKKSLQQRLIDDGLYVTNVDIFKDWNNGYSYLLKDIPVEMRTAVEKGAHLEASL